MLTVSLEAQQAPSGLVVVRPAEIVWQPVPPVLPPGAEFALLVGNPGEPGPFAMRVRVPANYRVGPHRHPVAEYVTILSGTLCIATGERTDYRQGTCLGAGAFFMTPANLAHALWTEGPAEYELHATGPFEGTYLNPADDPRRKPDR
ncbi:MAG: cupin domain-containing protein [Gemmatimonadales bacterium]